VAAVYAVMSITTGSIGSVAGAFGCLGGAGLILILVGAVCLSDFRKWNKTRTVKLVIHEKGLSYESKGQVESCSWEDIKDINHKLIEVKIKNSPTRKVSVMRSIVKRDGTVISFAETLDLEKITKLITQQRN
jgi:hypothetical protein